MSSEILRNVADLLGNALNSYESIMNVILCTREGVIVGAASKHEDIEPRILATVSAALTWVGDSALEKISKSRTSHLVLSTNRERVLILVQAHYTLIAVISKEKGDDSEQQNILGFFKSLAARIEVIMTASPEFSTATLLGNIVQHIPGVSKAMLLTLDGLPLAAIGFENEIEMAALVGSMFANGLTFSEETDHIILISDDVSFLIIRIDEKRLMVVASQLYRDPDDWELVIDVIHQSI